MPTMSLDRMNNYQTSSGSAYAVFQKLRNDNYFSWSASMESTLRSLNQWEVVIGQFPSPTSEQRTRTTARADSKAPTDAELELERRLLDTRVVTFA
jgi:hypothetical protein